MQSTFDLINDEKTLVVCNHSGGKDSQALYIFLSKTIPKERLVVIHADLPGADWPGIEEHIRSTISHEFYIVRSKKTFADMVRHRGMFPSPKYRQCTSDLKRNPINKKIRHICNERGFSTVINCTGIRAEESANRSKLKALRINKAQTNSKRTWFEWLPIFNLTTKTVFDTIAGAGQDPHWAYAAGMSRLSCVFCIMSSRSDLKTAARLMPEKLAQYNALEKEVNHTMMMPEKGKEPRFLKDIIEGKAAARIGAKKQLCLFGQ